MTSVTRLDARYKRYAAGVASRRMPIRLDQVIDTIMDADLVARSRPQAMQGLQAGVFWLRLDLWCALIVMWQGSLKADMKGWCIQGERRRGNARR